MLKRYKLKTLEKHTERSLLQRDTSHRNDPLKSLGFLVDETLFDDFEKLYDFGIEIGLSRKDVRIFTFVNTKKNIPSLRQNQISSKEFSWKGEIENDGAKEFLQLPFDVLIGYYHGSHKFLDAMVAQSRAKFKIGFNGADERLFDLLATVDLQNLEIFKAEVYKYLKILRKI